MEQTLSYISDIPWWGWVLFALFLIALRDVLQKKHTVSHNFPIVGHLRYMLETIGPELRQYIVANNREELPFTGVSAHGFMLLPKKKTIIKALVQTKTNMPPVLSLSILP